jgi:hypothetical protein
VRARVSEDKIEIAPRTIVDLPAAKRLPLSPLDEGRIFLREFRIHASRRTPIICSSTVVCLVVEASGQMYVDLGLDAYWDAKMLAEATRIAEEVCLKASNPFSDSATTTGRRPSIPGIPHCR